MKHEFKNVMELYDAVRGGFDVNVVEGAFVDIDRWNASPEDTPLVFFDEDDIYDDDDVEYEELENDDESIPRVAVVLGLRYFLVGPTIVDVFRVFDRQGKEPAIDSLVRAVNHYREFDSFEPA